MSGQTQVADVAAHGRGDPEPDDGNPTRRVGTPTADPAPPTPPVTPGWDRSPKSLALLLASGAERLRTDPPQNFSHCAVRGAAEVLRARLDERMGRSWEAARDATEGP